MYTKEEIIANEILWCPQHVNEPPEELGVCKECDEITAVWADHFVEFSKACASGKVPLPNIQFHPGHGPTEEEPMLTGKGG